MRLEKGRKLLQLRLSDSSIKNMKWNMKHMNYKCTLAIITIEELYSLYTNFEMIG